MSRLRTQAENKLRSEAKISNSTEVDSKWLVKQLILAAVLRIFLILYGEWHDSNIIPKYTDIDYHVFTDAAKYVTDGKSPYLRSTYRYTPILAWILTLNVYVHPIIGKIVFVACDIITGYLIYNLHTLYGTSQDGTRLSVLLWLFNPLTLVISTRGSADSLMTCLVLSTLYLLQTRRYTLAGVAFGLAVHFKIYPLIYSLPFYFSLQVSHGKKLFLWKLRNLFYPSVQRIKFTSTTITTLLTFTFVGYFCYGELFIKEAYLYHLVRKDTRHNFSPYFYMLYLSSGLDVPFLNLLTFLPQFILLLVITLKFYEGKNLPFCLFAQTFVFVSLNKVCTSQYFLWYIGLIPLIIPNLKMTCKQIGAHFVLWLSTQCVWLLLAFLLEFKGVNTFFYLWIAGLAFYLVNVYVFSQLIRNYKADRGNSLKLKF